VISSLARRWGVSEKEIRSALRKYCDELDLRARSSTGQKVRRAVVPLVLGAGLAVTACGDDEETGGPGPTTTTTGSGGSGATTSTGGTGGDGATTGSGGDQGGSGGEAGSGGAGGDQGGSGGIGVGGGLVYMAPD
jgi:hypothetical protein